MAWKAFAPFIGCIVLCINCNNSGSFSGQKPNGSTEEPQETKKRSTSESNVAAPQQKQEEPKPEVIVSEEPKPSVVVEEETEETIEMAPPATEFDAIAALPDGDEQLAILCARGGMDRVRKVFCSPTPPAVDSLVTLQSALSLDLATSNPRFVLTGHSSSLVARFVNAINPRVILFDNPNNIPLDFTLLGFARGEQFAELISADEITGELKFFLVHFQQACNDTEEGCHEGELLTPMVESNWTGYTIYEDIDLRNTVFDCLQCHQPNGPGTAKMLRMQELEDPWTHFMRDNRPGGQALLADYFAAHGNQESYGGIPAAQISDSDPARLEDFVRDTGFAVQPNQFIGNNGDAIEEANTPEERLALWMPLYEAYAAGTVIAPPFVEVKVTDPAKLATATQNYQNFLNGTIQAKDLPDTREIFDESRAWQMGFAVRPGAPANEILLTACGQCHNSNLDQNISRAKFNVNLATMSREEKDIAIERLNLPENDPKRMPPARFRDLNAEEIATLEALLKQ